MSRATKPPAERLKAVGHKKKVYRKKTSTGVAHVAPPMATVQTKLEQGALLNNNEQGVLNEDRVSKYVAEYIAGNKSMPSATNIAETLNMTIKTASKHLQKVIGNDFIKRMAKNLNGHVVAQHFNLIMDREKATAGLLTSWYDNFYDDPEKAKVPTNQSGNKITINIVGVSPTRIDAEDAEIIG
jgi:hypothetical protein